MLARPAPCARLAFSLLQLAVCVGGVQVIQAISNLRDAVDGPDSIDQGICECGLLGDVRVAV